MLFTKITNKAVLETFWFYLYIFLIWGSQHKPPNTSKFFATLISKTDETCLVINPNKLILRPKPTMVSRHIRAMIIFRRFFRIHVHVPYISFSVAYFRVFNFIPNTKSITRLSEQLPFIISRGFSFHSHPE